MADNIAIEMVSQEKRRNFFRTRTGIIITIFLLLVILAGFFSWWLAKGRISSVSANVDAIIYTVEPQYPSQLEKILVHPGDMVNAGQPLARIDTMPNGSLSSAQSQHYVGTTPFASNESISDRLRKAQQMEQEMVARVNQARTQEERLEKVMQERVSEHVRAQLAMRSINPRDQVAYNLAREAEANAKAVMDQAKNDFEQYSRMRAAQDTELKKLRAELQRFRRAFNIQPNNRQPVQQTMPAGIPMESDIYAPVAGKILKVLSHTGENVAPGQPLFLILPTQPDKKSDFWIQAWFPWDALGKIKPGQKANIHLGEKELNITGKVLSVADGAQTLPDPSGASVNINSLNREDKEKFNAIRYLAVKIGFDSSAETGSLAPGIKVQCQVQTRDLFSFFE